MSSTLNRRRALQLTGASCGALGLGGLAGRLYAAPLDGPRFLLVFLRGGYDATNLLIPYSSSFYYEARPTIAIAPPIAPPAAAAAAGTTNSDATRAHATDADGTDAGAARTRAMALDADWALTPVLRDTIGALYAQRQVAFVPFCGTDDLSRSHFETQDSVELGQPTDAERNYHSGFMARLADALTRSGSAAPAMAFTDSLPLSFSGPTPVPNMSLKGAGPGRVDEREASVLLSMYAGRPLEPQVASGLAVRAQVAQTLGAMDEEMRAASRGAVDSRGFELTAERIAVMMRDRYRIGFVDVGGWDTHVNQGAAQGQLATHLAALGRGLAAYAAALGPQWRNTVVVVLSEFGRTFRENGGGGTDHGHGTVYWVLGGAIDGGRIAGAQVRVARETLFQDRDYPVLNDYRAVLGGLFRSLWQLPAARCTQIFPQTVPLDLKLA
jgi:uncharacterized protein (DUF1501 family)